MQMILISDNGSKNSFDVVEQKELTLSLWQYYLVIKNTEQNVKLLSIKSIYFSQELNTDIALYRVAIPLPCEKLSQATLYTKSPVSWKYEVTVQKYAQH